MPPSKDRPWAIIARWYRLHGRALPWRLADRADSAFRREYRIAVSEFMLQQTQVDRVVPLFKRFIAEFPSWRALAVARLSDVIRAWKGLGYNLRALRLKRMAEEIVAQHRGRLPETMETLLALKGIGPYTARALRAFAFHKRALAPDTNIRRVLNRLFNGPSADPTAINERIWSRWESTLPEPLSHDVNQGLMDIGATICKAGKPSCHACPLRSFCRSYPRILAMRRLPKQKRARKERVDAHGIPNRIYRGRVIDRLRRGSASEADLAGLLHVLPGLEKDGLILRRQGRWRLA